MPLETWSLLSYTRALHRYTTREIRGATVGRRINTTGASRCKAEIQESEGRRTVEAEETSMDLVDLQSQTTILWLARHKCALKLSANRHKEQERRRSKLEISNLPYFLNAKMSRESLRVDKWGLNWQVFSRFSRLFLYYADSLSYLA